ncbi:MAG: hypothetical protein CMM47_04520 [Rhodospirillaceae bacterium]|nr:hypothetical protein [Rhodospirillaceae bacterium]
MDIEAVQKTYNQVGSTLIEKLYSEDYLSIGGTVSTDILANYAEINEQSYVLDVGSGLGGPALHLAGSRGCRVTGLDLIPTNVEQAKCRAEERGLQNLANFQVGNATELPFNSNSFNVVWGQDAWCHVADKARLISECVRVLKPGGTVAFSDWLQTAQMNQAQSKQIHDATASTNMATMALYSELLFENGLSIKKYENISATFIQQYRTIITRLGDIEKEISEQFSPKIYEILRKKNVTILRGFEEGLIGGGRIIAT